MCSCNVFYYIVALNIRSNPILIGLSRCSNLIFLIGLCVGSNPIFLIGLCIGSTPIFEIGLCIHSKPIFIIGLNVCSKKLRLKERMSQTQNSWRLIFNLEPCCLYRNYRIQTYFVCRWKCLCMHLTQTFVCCSIQLFSLKKIFSVKTLEIENV